MPAPEPSPDLDAALAELTDANTRAVNILTRMMEIEQAAAELAFAWLPKPGAEPASLAEAAAAGAAIDSFNTMMAATTQRIDLLARAEHRLSRSLRLTVALRRRLQSGWTGATAADTRAAMQRRQIKRGVADTIGREAAERETEDLFAELDEKLEDPGLDAEIEATSVEHVIARICRELGLPAPTPAPVLHPSDAPPAKPPDTG
jgi:hypothetical protein